MTLEPGQLLDGKFLIVRAIGGGAMGQVYEGEHVRIHRRVAIKELLPAFSSRPDVAPRFEREAQAAGRIGSEHIVEVLDLGALPNGGLYMVMEYLDGMTLAARLHATGRMPPSEIVPLVQQLLTGLAAAHAVGIVHRDLKPDNVFLCRETAGHRDFVKILDFGVSKFRPREGDLSMTETGSIFGTPLYMAPEQAEGAKDIDARADLYSVGIILYEALTAQRPFVANSYNELLYKIALEPPPPVDRVVPGLDAAFGQLVQRAMARDPQDRFQTAVEFRDALDRWLYGNGVRPSVPAVVGPLGGGTMLIDSVEPGGRAAPPLELGVGGATRMLDPSEVGIAPYAFPLANGAAPAYSHGPAQGFVAQPVGAPSTPAPFHPYGARVANERTPQPKRSKLGFLVAAVAFLAVGMLLGVVVLRPYFAQRKAPDPAVASAEGSQPPVTSTPPDTHAGAVAPSAEAAASAVDAPLRPAASAEASAAPSDRTATPSTSASTGPQLSPAGVPSSKALSTTRLPSRPTFTAPRPKPGASRAIKTEL